MMMTALLHVAIGQLAVTHNIYGRDTFDRPGVSADRSKPTQSDAATSYVC